MFTAIPRRAALALLAAAAALPFPAHALAATTPFKPFAPDSVWNLPLRPDAPLSPDSGRYMTWMQAQYATKGGWINSTQCGMPLYWADATTPTVTVTLNHPSYQDPALMRAWAAVPIPANAQPANCSDHNFAVAQTQPDGRIKEWEFWAASKRTDGTWVAQWGGAMDDMRTDRGIASSIAWYDPTGPTWTSRYSTPGWNVTASSVSQSAGVMTQAELRAGKVDHALSLALSDTAKGRWLWPAQRTDGGLTDPNALPEGAHLRLPASLDLSTYTMVPAVRMIAEAAQKYGIVVRDRTFDKDIFYAEPPAPGQPDALAAALGGKNAYDALKAFPWNKLQVLDAPTCTNWSGCYVTPQASLIVDPPAGGTIRVGDTVTLDTTNSVLDQPRSKVEWDLNGDGTYETPDGIAVKRALTVLSSGTKTVGVRITTRDKKVVTGAASFTVASATTAPAPAPATSPALVVSLTPTSGAPAPSSPAPKGRVVRGRVALSRGGTISLALRCPAGTAHCSGSAHASLGRGLRVGRTRLAAGHRLGYTRYSLASGAKGRARIRIAKRVVRALRVARLSPAGVKVTLRD